MIRITLSERADDDLESILDYGIATHGHAVAYDYLRTIDSSVAQLIDFPGLGAERADLSAGLRSLPVGEHRVYYRIEPEAIRIVRVLHKAMDPMRHL